MVSPRVQVSGAIIDNLYIECLSQSFGSIDSASVHPTNSFKDGTGDEPPNLAALIQMLGDLPPRLDLQDIPRSTSSDTGIFSMFKGRSEEKSSISTPLATAPKSPTYAPQSFNCNVRSDTNKFQVLAVYSLQQTYLNRR